ncbi:phosphoglycerate mutase-like protein [Phellopilus nigrolimitatus]|nr:phosphoglycerate mutase-like protein [Phellopilus nigrolimitatus]
MASDPVVRVYLVRHGETNENRAGIIQGQMDTLLNAEGHLQAQLCGERMKDISFAFAFSSDLKRTLKIILAHHPAVILVEDEGLRERNMGEVQGVRVGQYDKSKLPKYAEAGEVFTRRVLTWWEETIGRHLPSLRQTALIHILVVSHGAFIATLCRTLVLHRIIDPGSNGRIGSCYNTSVTTIDMRRDKRGTLVNYSDISHLLLPVVEKNADEQPL